MSEPELPRASPHPDRSGLPPPAADLLVTGADIVTVDTGRRVIRDGAIAVTGG